MHKWSKGVQKLSSGELERGCQGVKRDGSVRFDQKGIYLLNHK
jgi:hypothetical protein